MRISDWSSDVCSSDLSADLADIGHYYGQYRRLMAHWRALYPDSIFEFDYDEFVADPKAVLPPLFEFLGLPWEEQCLQFHRLDRSEERRGGKACVSTCRSGGWAYN